MQQVIDLNYKRHERDVHLAKCNRYRDKIVDDLATVQAALIDLQQNYTVPMVLKIGDKEVRLSNKHLEIQEYLLNFLCEYLSDQVKMVDDEMKGGVT